MVTKQNLTQHSVTRNMAIDKQNKYSKDAKHTLYK